MKKSFILMLGLFASVCSYAQFEQGTLMIGGSAGLEFTKDKNKNGGTTVERSKTTNFFLEPQVGYFVIDRLAIGGGLGLGLSSTKYTDEYGGDKVNSTRIAVEPFARYYLPQNIFFQGKFMVGSVSYKEKNDGRTEKDSYSLTGFALSAGYSILLNDNVAIEPQVGYQSEAQKDGDWKYVDSGFYLRAGLQVYLR